ncbi:CAAX prenyl protease-like protein [Enterobacter sp. BIGb0383]|uniref:CPBP family intramembrane glutamic endopeptidase n=1 Tax=unclassified Enterobacter TaxID=2608935 RepID=UPI000F46A6CB|nr:MULTISPECIES: CPBP family intramembrane glutamic endopeptidase [unclassified Enterobacter]ROP49431.1 CAAX prenyl protease-like protein [Enterobacter sp. BIGb0383]ROS00693.1 CAAX prenyl protease-like protein [Enterobacter sp. BIGb0359]
MITLYRHTVLFYLLSTLIPWACWFGAAWISREGATLSSSASFLALTGLCTPMLIAGFLIGTNRMLRRDVFSRLLQWRAPGRYYLLACVLMPLTIAIAMGISLLFGYSDRQFVIDTQFSFTSGIFPAWLILIAAPVLEELGWHSYGTDCLRRKYNLFITSVIFALFWGIWHMPLSAIPGYYHNDLVVTGLLYSVNFLLSLIPFVFLMNWLYYKTERNISVAVVFHVTAGLFNEIFNPHPDSKIIQTGILMIITIWVVLADKDFFFRQKYK